MVKVGGAHPTKTEPPNFSRIVARGPTAFSATHGWRPATRVVRIVRASRRVLGRVWRSGNLSMKFRPLGRTGLELSWLSFGASSLGAEFRSIDLNEAMRSVRVALDLGMNFIDTSPFYGRGMSECLLGVALRGVPRESYLLGTKLGRYDRAHFDFSARRVVESVDVSLHRMGVDHLDIMLCHDIEFVEMSQIVEETLPALRKIKEQGKA